MWTKWSEDIVPKAIASGRSKEQEGSRKGGGEAGRVRGREGGRNGRSQESRPRPYSWKSGPLVVLLPMWSAHNVFALLP